MGSVHLRVRNDGVWHCPVMLCTAVHNPLAFKHEQYTDDPTRVTCRECRRSKHWLVNVERVIAEGGRVAERCARELERLEGRRSRNRTQGVMR